MKKLLLGLFVFCAGCSSSGVNHKAYDLRSTANSPVRPTALSHEMAWMRSRQVGKVTYILWFGLDEGSESYDGRVVVNFELKDLKKTIPPEILKEIRDQAQIVALDFEGGEVQSLKVNSTPINLAEKNPHFKTRYDGHRIYLHSSELLPSGANRIEIAFSQHFSTEGHGFHRFKDSEDGKTYLYTNSEPYDAHRIFPCFDQPDLKASYELTVEAPPEWQIIANTMERDISTVDGRKSWAFPPSPVFSTYLFELAAGPYASWKSAYNGMPMRLFARQSIKKYVNKDDWFGTTIKGLEYYGSYFGYPYPYAKYDQIIVPEFNSGAMENVAAITFGERFVPRSKPTALDNRARASVILHEMAHQWFGDLVTMRWWNGLWLNESFATFMATKALDEATDFSGAWQEFYGEKSWALWEDQLVTTHPIEVPISDTEAAENNFDGITYGKGASALQQLHFYLGDDDFREGLQRYFMKYALRNTTINDFIRMLSEASGKDLSKWQKAWLQSAGVNGVRVDWACNADGEISKFNIIQTPALEGSPELRTHKTQIALYDLKGMGSLKIRPKGVVDVTYSQAETPVPELIGKTCPSFVFPNNGNYDYAKIELDPASLEVARKNLNRFETPLMRRVVWHTLRQMVVDGKMRPQDYFDTFLAQGAGERDADLLSTLLSDTMDTHRMRGLARYFPDSMRPDYLKKLEAQAIKSLKVAAPGSDVQRLWFEAFNQIAHSSESVDYAQKLLSGQAKLAGFPIDKNERWDLIETIARNGSADSEKLINEELKRDPSDMGIHSAVKSLVSLPDAANKKKWLGYFMAPLDGKTPVTDNGISLNPLRLRTAFSTYLSLWGDPVAKDTIDPYFQAVPRLKEISDKPYAHWFARGLFPSLCDPAVVSKTTAILEKTQGIPVAVAKALKVSRQEEERCIRARAKATEGSTATTSGI